MAAGAGSPAERRSSRPNWRRSRPRSVRRTQNSGCGGKKGRSPRLRGPRADPQRGSAPVLRFCALLGIPRASWYRWKSAVRTRPGCWPAPVVDALEPVAASYAATFAAWGHRKLWALLQADGYQVSMSSVARALARRGLLLPQRYQAERRQLARARRAVFLEPPTRRCRVWQSDFSEFETIGGGVWRPCGVVASVAKALLAFPVTTTQTAVDSIGALEAARI